MISAHELNFFILLFLIFLPPQQPALICLELVSILCADSWELKGPQSAVLGGKPWIFNLEFLEFLFTTHLLCFVSPKKYRQLSTLIYKLTSN